MLLVVAVAFASWGQLANAADASKPNIVIIYADDLGYGDVGCFGQTRIRTPHLDRLAKDGVRFTQCYAGSTVCAPSRCALMTGLHTGHCRVRGNGGGGGPRANVPLRPDDPCVADILKRLRLTTLVVTHDLPYALELCERSVILNNGSIVADGPTAELLCDRELMAANRLELPYGFDPSYLEV